jgi:tyrosine-protein kinase Etk/Wzc
VAETTESKSRLSAVEDQRLMNQIGPDIDDDELDLGELIGVLIENRWLILIIMLVTSALGWMKAWTETPIYQADALLQVEEKQSGMVTLEASELFGGDTSVYSEIEIIKSRSVLGTVVDNLKLDIVAGPEYSPFFGEALARRMPADVRPLIRIDSLELPESMKGQSLTLVATGTSSYEVLDESTNLILRGNVGETAGGDAISLFVSKMQGEAGQRFYVQKWPRVLAINSLQNRLSVKEKSDWSSVLSATLEGTDPESVRQQLDGIADAYVRQNVERKSAEAEKTLEFLDEQLPTVRQRMEAAELSLNSYRLEKGSIDLPLETQSILATIVQVENELNTLEQEREKVTLAFTGNHPTVIALDRQIRRANNELAELNSQVRDLPTTQQEVLSLIRDVEVNTVLYTSLLNTAQELRVAKAGTVGNVRVIDYAVEPTIPVSPRKFRILLLSILLGGFLGVAAAFARKALKGGVEDPDLVENHVHVPVYATILHSKRQQKIYGDLKSKQVNSAILAEDSPDDAAIESLRNLRTALHFGMMDVKNNCIMIAGPSPEIGKSFISVNLAAVLTSNNKKVLLIDGDMRRGHLHEYLGVSRDNGLSEFISGEIPIGGALRETRINGLTFIPTGRIPPNPSELLLHKRFTNCLSVLTPRYDHIIIDSPPILAVTDATIIGQMAGGTLMVLKSGEHPMREIDQAVKRLQQSGVNLRGLLFNDVSIQSQRYGAGKYSYQYSYKNS